VVKSHFFVYHFMAKTKEQKKIHLEDLAKDMKDAKSVVFASVQGLNVKDTDELRKNCREQNLTYVVSKKTLLRKALQDLGLATDTSVYEGGVAVVCGLKDEVAPAQMLAKFAKTHEVMKLFGGILEGKLVDGTMVKQLSALPSKQELLAKLAGSLNAPVSGFVNVLAGNLRGLVGVLNNIKNAKI
jgi:large subunit ribosomal protein L10